jgi:hypothetical protein
MVLAVRLTGTMTRCRIRRISVGGAVRAASLMPLLAIGGCAFGSSSSGSLPCFIGAGSSDLVVFQRSGGIAGVGDRLTVDSHGVALLTKRGGRQSQATLSQQELNQLKETLAHADFQSLEPEYLNANARDSFLYTVSYSCRVVRADETSVPGQLRPVIDQLTTLESHVGS